MAFEHLCQDFSDYVHHLSPSPFSLNVFSVLLICWYVRTILYGKYYKTDLFYFIPLKNSVALLLLFIFEMKNWKTKRVSGCTIVTSEQMTELATESPGSIPEFHLLHSDKPHGPLHSQGMRQSFETTLWLRARVCVCLSYIYLIKLLFKNINVGSNFFTF